MTHTLAIAMLILVVGQTGPDAAPSEKVAFAELSAADRLAFVKNEAALYEFVLDRAENANSKRLVLVEPVLRFNDNVTGVVDGVLVLWHQDGRPEASASIWHRSDGLTVHEFQSLSESRVLAKRDDRTVWHPQTPGVEPKRFEDAPDPANTPVGRLSQMRALMRRFDGAVVGRSGHSHLRLLSQPVARFGKEGASVLDATWFAFAKGTNPEIMVLIEARLGNDGKHAWHYAPVRMTSGQCELKLDDDVVWSVQRTRRETSQDTYYNIYSRK